MEAFKICTYGRTELAQLYLSAHGLVRQSKNIYIDSVEVLGKP